jgi:anti-sigma-K factor RskA
MVYTFDIVDIKEYIASGILESVALGLASEQEQQEVRCLSKIYPEIQEEFVRIQQRTEAFFMEQAVAPKPEVKTVIMESIRKEKQLNPGSEAVPTPKIIALNPKQSNPWRMMAAASIVLALGLGALLIVNRSKVADMNTQLSSMEKEQAKNEQLVQALAMEQQHLREVQEVLSDENTHTIMMKGTAMEPDATVKIMWSKGMKKAVMHAEKIAPPPSNMQYQLWAIVDGKPMSVGVFTYDEVDQMTTPFDVGMSNVAAFAITLEKMGGSPTPTLEKMVVMGTTNS